jgi:hypothetical protein
VKIRERKPSGSGKDLLHPTMCLKNIKGKKSSRSIISDYSVSDISSSSKLIESNSSIGYESDENKSIGHKSMKEISKKETNQSRTHTSTTNLRLTRSRSYIDSGSNKNKSAQ